MNVKIQKDLLKGHLNKSLCFAQITFWVNLKKSNLTGNFLNGDLSLGNLTDLHNTSRGVWKTRIANSDQ